MKDIELIKKIEYINACVDESINSSEKLGMEVYEIITLYENNTEKLLEKINIFLNNYFIKNDVNDDGLVGKLFKIRKDLEFSLNSLVNLIEVSEEIFLCFFGESSEKSTISEIIKISNEIETVLLSLSSTATNSSITASQLGEAGGAYSIISKEIQKEAKNLNLHFSNIYEIIDKSFPQLDELRNNILKFRDKDELKISISTLTLELQKVEKQLFSFKDKILKNMDENKKRVPELLAHLVNQDIFRQELEHIKEFMCEANARISYYESNENQGFINFVMKISKDIFDSGCEEFLYAFSKIDEEMEDITNNFLINLNYSIEDFGKYFDKNNKTSLNSLLEEMINIININNKLFIEDILNNLSNLKVFLNDFKYKIENLMDHIKTSQSIVKRFHTMRILLKAELVRLSDVLGKKSKDNETQFEEIINDVEYKTTLIKKVIEDLELIYQQNEDKFATYERLSSYRLNEKVLEELFDSMKEMINLMYMEFDKVNKEINKHQNTILNDKNNFKFKYEKLQNMIKNNSETFKNIINRNPDIYFDYEKDLYFKELIDKMTTYKERMVAKINFEYEDVGCKGGEFTLF